MTDPLPGMPVRYGDPGVFVCGPGDIAPWDNGPARQRGPAPRRATAGPRSWIVLRDCPDCSERWQLPCRQHVTALHDCPDCIDRPDRYCEQHNRVNWWLENFRPGQRR